MLRNTDSVCSPILGRTWTQWATWTRGSWGRWQICHQFLFSLQSVYKKKSPQFHFQGKPGYKGEKVCGVDTRNDNILSHLLWYNLLESVQISCTQGERGECGTPGIKGDTVWPLYKHHTISIVLPTSWSQSIIMLNFCVLFISLSNASGSCWFGWNEGTSRFAGQCSLCLFLWCLAVQVWVSTTFAL